MSLFSVKPLYSPSVTATNGSTTVTVTGNVNCAFISSGSIVSIGARQIVDAISGTGVDAGGNSTITLRRPWSEPTTTAPMLVFMSYEGLSESVFRLNQITEQAAANAQNAFVFRGNYDLAAAGALPPAPSAGSEMWRIASAATVGGRAYAQGEPIYYDQYLTQWRSYWDGLGTAAFRNVMTSLTDTTTPDALMPRGAFGVGGVSPYGNNFANVSDVTQFFTQSVPTNALDGVNSDGNWWHCLKLVSPDPNLPNRPRALIGVKTHQTGGFPIAPQLWLSQLDANGNPQRTVRALMQGDFGVGANAGILITNANTLNATGFYQGAGEWIGSPFAGANGRNQGTIIHIQWGGSNEYAAQYFFPINGAFAPRVRRKDFNVWSDWRLEYNQANILGTVSQSAGVPTGAIIQRGANANGEFTRFADGTQMGWMIADSGTTPTSPMGSVFTTSNRVWTFPIAFIDGNVAFTVCEHSGVGRTWAGLGDSAVTATSASYCGYRATSVLMPMTFSLKAQGRWFNL